MSNNIFENYIVCILEKKILGVMPLTIFFIVERTHEIRFYLFMLVNIFMMVKKIKFLIY